MNTLKNIKIACIGTGNMGKALTIGLCSHVSPKNIFIYDIDSVQSVKLSEDYKVNISKSANEASEHADIIIIAVKPYIIVDVLGQIKDVVKDKTVVSIAAGITISSIAEKLHPETKIIRAMPNTPALVDKGMTVLTASPNTHKDVLENVKDMFRCVGEVIELPENLLDAVTGLSGSGPAFVFTFIQALTAAAVKLGIPRKEALLLSSQTVMGSAAMVIEKREIPIALRVNVASPGGTTIEGIHVLEESGFSGIVMDAVIKAAEKSKQLSQK
jgi:pyrroline-5-carboxylate reductase